MKRRTISVLALALAACASPKKSSFVDAATMPLRDLNVLHDSIPAVLKDAQRKPYLAPSDQSCPALSAEVRALDEVLGPDFDVPAPASDPGLVERGTTMAGDAAVDAVQGAAEAVVPFRRWVRELSGAERQSKKVAAAIAAGTVRRAFLKGMSAARGCP
jgi:hypothetical protein